MVKVEYKLENACMVIIVEIVVLKMIVVSKINKKL